MTTKKTYTREQLEIELLKQSRDTIGETLKRLESKIDSQLHWTMGLLFGLYAMIIKARQHGTFRRPDARQGTKSRPSPTEPERGAGGV